MTGWMVLLPTGDDAEILNSPAVTRPHVVTEAQMQGIAKAVEALRAAGLPVDLEGLLAARPVDVPAPPTATPVGEDEPPTTPPRALPPDETTSWACTCGKSWTRATGGRAAMLEHQRTCGLWTDRGGRNLPPEYDALLP